MFIDQSHERIGWSNFLSRENVSNENSRTEKESQKKGPSAVPLILPFFDYLSTTLVLHVPCGAAGGHDTLCARLVHAPKRYSRPAHPKCSPLRTTILPIYRNSLTSPAAAATVNSVSGAQADTQRQSGPNAQHASVRTGDSAGATGWLLVLGKRSAPPMNCMTQGQGRHRPERCRAASPKGIQGTATTLLEPHAGATGRAPHLTAVACTERAGWHGATLRDRSQEVARTPGRWRWSSSSRTARIHQDPTVAKNTKTGLLSCSSSRLRMIAHRQSACAGVRPVSSCWTQVHDPALVHAPKA